jgi:hypothetical protein
MNPYPVAASAALAPVLTGPPRRVEVVAALPGVVYLSTGDPACPAICVATAGSVRVPCAAVLPAGAVPPELRVGTAGVAGAGGLSVGPLAVRVRRWWVPPRPRLAGPGELPPDELLPGRLPPGELLPGRLLPGRLPEVDALLGAGPGLTPYGDDVLAGALVTLAALGAPVTGFAARARVFERTTFVSAALLVHAARGECVPQLAALVTALRTGSVATEVAALLAVGHTSGAGLLEGVRAILPYPHLVGAG